MEGDLYIANCVEQNADDDDVSADFETGAVDVRYIAKQMQQRAYKLCTHKNGRPVFSGWHSGTVPRAPRL